MKTLLLAVLTTLMLTQSVSAQVRYIVTSNNVVLEQAWVEVTRFDERSGDGTLIVRELECDDCDQVLSFDVDTRFDTPLGEYRGLAQFDAWGDQMMMVLIDPELERAIEIRVVSL